MSGDDERQFRMALPGVGNLPARLLCATVAHPLMYVSLLIVVPLVLLGVMFFASTEYGGVTYYGLYPVFVYFLLHDSYVYYSATVGIDTDRELLTVTHEHEGWVFGGLVGNREVDLSTLRSASFTRVGSVVVVRLDSPKPFVSHPVAVPADRVEAVAETLEACGVRTPEYVREVGLSPEPGREVRQARLTVTLAVALAVLPVLVLVVRPAAFQPTMGFLIGVALLVALAVSRLRHALGTGSTGSEDSPARSEKAASRTQSENVGSRTQSEEVVSRTRSGER